MDNIPDKALTSKHEHIVRTNLNVRGQSKRSKAQLYLICAVFWVLYSAAAVEMKLLLSLLRLIAGPISVEKPLPHLFPGSHNAHNGSTL